MWFEKLMWISETVENRYHGRAAIHYAVSRTRWQHGRMNGRPTVIALPGTLINFLNPIMASGDLSADIPTDQKGRVFSRTFSPFSVIHADKSLDALKGAPLPFCLFHLAPTQISYNSHKLP